MKYDQRLKYQVRDAVIAVASPLLRDAADAREARDVRIHSTSGRVVLNQQTMPETIQLASTSGGAALAVPGDAGFTAEISTTSGRVDMALPAKKTGNRYVCGDGSAQVSIHSTSGNVSVAAFQP